MSKDLVSATNQTRIECLLVRIRVTETLCRPRIAAQNNIWPFILYKEVHI
jgi:hypothetical protein